MLTKSFRLDFFAPFIGLSCLALFGWTVGGVVALEYDVSPVSQPWPSPERHTQPAKKLDKNLQWF
jgi:hypothetical protein